MYTQYDPEADTYQPSDTFSETDYDEPEPHPIRTIIRIGITILVVGSMLIALLAPVIAALSR